MTLYGFDASGWDDDMRDGIRIIADVAVSPEKTIAYSDFVTRLGRHAARSVGGNLLDPLARATNETARCIVTSVVVQKEPPCIPGDRFFQTAEDLGYPVHNRYEFWERQRAAAEDYFRTVHPQG